MGKQFCILQLLTVNHHQGDQIGRFFTIWALFEA